jgi:hypothetical protein
MQSIDDAKMSPTPSPSAQAAAEESKETAGYSGPIGLARGRIQQEPNTHCRNTGTHCFRDQYDRAICADLVPKQVRITYILRTTILILVQTRED